MVLTGDSWIHYCSRILEEAKVRMTQKQFDTLMQLIQDYNNSAHLWVNRGWTPTELSRRYAPQGIKEISLGPGIQKMINEGNIDIEEFRQRLAEMGIELLK